MAKNTRTALVTGGAHGIGQGIVLHLLKTGWHVAALDRDGAGLEGLPEGVMRLRADVADEAQVKAAVETLDRLDLLVNNAGIAGPEAGPVEDLALADWQRWIDVNLTGAFLMAKHAVPLLRQGGGAIVNITSTRALQSEPDCEPYAAAKGGLAALTHALAVSLGPDIRVNAIAPGWIDPGGEELSETDRAQHPAGRVGRPQDIAEAVEWLADAGFVTGQTVVIDGGMTRKMIYAD
ncbi:SDR family oxidoreductase [Tranquillimonas alkanivorans]|uniref:NAD(P)-dependent dehydrogenase, short-chain alcohol dehydrogenase family n=1 Tax=Tranquillimonas alkanivorans TaxID=441119 RepID=A0A1I5T0U5_9RHOB|nr:SDR family oxidoreductase [Tranquillimonas alkanivorans]SFP76660.1 NAD(P)-dependent dehydrogenase, short-chain alcohol dehydrogenase family [Tranquillimonas alkanivorans]